MLIPAILRSILMYGGLVAAAICILVWKERGPAQRTALMKWLPAGGILLGLAISLWTYMHDVEVYLVEQDGNKTTVTRRYAMTAVRYDLAPGEKEKKDAFGHSYDWVVNRSSHPVRVETIEYGMSFGGSEPDVAPPGTAIMVSDVDHIGPNDRPPASVKAASKIGTTLYWLTWDR